MSKFYDNLPAIFSTVFTSKKRTITYILILTVSILLINNIFSTVYYVNDNLFPTYVDRNPLNENNELSFTIQGHIGSSSDNSWDKFSSDLPDQLMQESLTYVPDAIKSMININPKGVWNIDLLNATTEQEDEFGRPIELSGIPSNDFSEIKQILGISSDLEFNAFEGITIRENLSNPSQFNISGKIEAEREADYFDSHEFTLLSGVDISFTLRRQLGTIIGHDLFSQVNHIILPLDSLVDTILSFNRISTQLEGFFQWSWKDDLNDDELGTFEANIEALQDQSGFLYANRDFNVEYHDEYTDDLEKFRELEFKFLVAVISVLSIVILIIFFTAIQALRIQEPSFIEDLNRLKLFNVSSSKYIATILGERSLHLVGTYILSTILFFIELYISNLLDIFSAYLHSFKVFNLIFLLSSIFYMIYSLYVGVKLYLKEHDTIDISLSVSLKEHVIIVGIPFIFQISLLLLSRIPFIVADESISDTMGRLLSLTNVVSIILVSTLIVRILATTITHISKQIRSKKIKFDLKFFHEINWSSLVIFTLVVTLLISSMTISTIMETNLDQEVDMKVPSDAVISGIPVNTEGLTSVRSTLSNYTELKKTLVISFNLVSPNQNYEVLAVQENFSSLLARPEYRDGEDWHEIPEIGLSDGIPEIYTSFNHDGNQINLEIYNGSIETGGNVIDQYYTIKGNYQGYYDVFPFIRPVEYSQRSEENRPSIVMPMEYAEFLINNATEAVTDSTLYQSEIKVLINGEEQRINQLVDEIAEGSGDVSVIFRKNAHDIYKHSFYDLSQLTFSASLWITTLLFFTTTIIYSFYTIGSSDEQIIRYTKMLKFDDTKLMSYRTISLVSNTTLGVIISAIMGIWIVILQIDLYDIKNVYHMWDLIGEIALFVFSFSLVWILIMIFGFARNVKNIDLLSVEEI